MPVISRRWRKRNVGRKERSPDSTHATSASERDHGSWEAPSMELGRPGVVFKDCAGLDERRAISDRSHGDQRPL